MDTEKLLPLFLLVLAVALLTVLAPILLGMWR